MGYVFCHHSGKKQHSETAIKTLLHYDAFFRKNTNKEYAKPALLMQLRELKDIMFKGLLLDTDYQITVRQVSNLSNIFLFCGNRSSVDWAASMQQRQLVFEKLIPVSFDALYPHLKPMAKAV